MSYLKKRKKKTKTYFFQLNFLHRSFFLFFLQHKEKKKKNELCKKFREEV